MKQNDGDVIYRINCLACDLDGLYHQAALKLGLSDSVMFVLYFVYENSGKCPLNEICRETNISKQTINSAIRKLEQDHLIYLEQQSGRAKTVCFTEQGNAYAEQTIARLFHAERGIFHGWTEEDISQYLHLMERYNRDFREQIAQL